jgi:hypothetical protein
LAAWRANDPVLAECPLFYAVRARTPIDGPLKE